MLIRCFFLCLFDCSLILIHICLEQRASNMVPFDVQWLANFSMEIFLLPQRVCWGRKTGRINDCEKEKSRFELKTLPSIRWIHLPCEHLNRKSLSINNNIESLSNRIWNEQNKMKWMPLCMLRICTCCQICSLCHKWCIKMSIFNESTHAGAWFMPSPSIFIIREHVWFILIICVPRMNNRHHRRYDCYSMRLCTAWTTFHCFPFDEKHHRSRTCVCMCLCVS